MAEETEEENAPLKPFWSGVVTFGLVGVPVSLFPAIRGPALRLRMVDTAGTFLKRRFFSMENNTALAAEDLARGYELEKDRFVIVEDDELNALDPERSREIDLRQFVAVQDLSPLTFERAYFLVPEGRTTKAYRLLAEVLENDKRAGIATFVMRGKEYLCAIIAEHGILQVETLRFAAEVRSPDTIGLPTKLSADKTAVSRFATAIDKLKGTMLDRTALQDTNSARIIKLARKKLKKGTNVVPGTAGADNVPESSTNVIDLMQVLKERLQGKLRARDTSAQSGSPRLARPDNIKSRTKSELYQLAQDMGVRGRSTMSKAQLIDALESQTH